jgi:Flp pilus assembly protein TadG
MLSQRLETAFARFRHENDGATAIEFSILALPFMVLIFGILELAIVFFTTTSLNHSLVTNTRDIRVGASEAICGDIDRIKTDVCTTFNTKGCFDNLNLNISRVNSNQFNASVLGQFQAASFTVNETDDTVEAVGGNVLDTGITGNEIVLVKAVYQHDLILPGQLTRLANFGLKNKRVITVTQAMRTEPFPNVDCATGTPT